MSGRAHLPTLASVSGTLGVAALNGPFFVLSGLELRPALFNAHGPRWSHTGPIQGHAGLCYQVNHFAKYVGEGLNESPLHTHRDTVSVLRMGDEIRRLVGVKVALTSG